MTLPATDSFVVRDAIALGREYGEYTVTYVGPNFLRLFGEEAVAAQPEHAVRHVTLGEWTDDQSLAPVAGPDAGVAGLFAALAWGGTARAVSSESPNTVYRSAAGGRWTPHFYTRGTRLGFGALPFGDQVG